MSYIVCCVNCWLSTVDCITAFLNIPNAVSFGLTFAAVGYLVSSFVGVPLANWGIRKGYTVNAPRELPKDFLTGISKINNGPNAGKLTTHPGNIDGIAFQLAMLMTTLFVTYFACLGLKAILPGPIKALAFGLMFLWGMLIAVAIRLILGKLGLTVYLDNNVQRRITGIAVDYMIVATLIAVKFAIVWAFILPITILCLVVSVCTIFFLIYFGSRLDHFGFERFMGIFGTCTGTGASGLLLLRIVDPEFKSPAAQELGLMNAFTLLLIPTTLIIYPLPKVGIMPALLLSAGIIIVCLVLLKVFKFWGKPNWN